MLLPSFLPPFSAAAPSGLPAGAPDPPAQKRPAAESFRGTPEIPIEHRAALLVEQRPWQAEARLAVPELGAATSAEGVQARRSSSLISRRSRSARVCLQLMLGLNRRVQR